MSKGEGVKTMMGKRVETAEPSSWELRTLDGQLWSLHGLSWVLCLWKTVVCLGLLGGTLSSGTRICPWYMSWLLESISYGVMPLGLDAEGRVLVLPKLNVSDFVDSP